jgi:DNA polymerase-3 subunit delta'
MQFSEIHGLDKIKNQLIQAVKKDHVAHAQLFLGEEGGANLALAIAFATYLNCQDPGENDSCGQCPSCVKNKKHIHPDVHYVFPVSSTTKVKGKDVVSNNFLKEWRQFLDEGVFGDLTDWSLIFGGENKNLNISKEESRQVIQKLSLTAFEGEYKILIIWMPEYMHPSAANGLLKVLEEPSDRTVFLLVAQDEERLLGTILSRTQKVMVRRFNHQEVQQQLLTSGVSQEKASHIARLVAGNMKLALKLANDGDEDHGTSFKEWMRLCYGADHKQLVHWSDDFHKMNKINQRGFFRFGLSLLRETLLSHYGDPQLIMLNDSEKEFVRKFSTVVTPEVIEPLCNLFTEALFHLERNGSAKMIFLDASLKVIQQLKKVHLEAQN